MAPRRRNLTVAAPRLLRAALTRTALAACAAALPGASHAHEFWLESSRYQGAAGDTVEVRAFVGTGFRGELKPYAPTRVRRFELRTARPTDLATVGRNGDLLFAVFVLPDGGGALVAYHSTPVFLELEAARFDTYLRTEGLAGPLAARAALGPAAGPGRERYARCCKSWIAGGDLRRALEPVGLPLEIVPLADPTANGPLPVRVLCDGKPLAGALVRAWRNEHPAAASAAVRDSVGPSCETRTDARGQATLPLDRPGEWLLSAVHMEPSSTPGADWESLWASFTFARPTPSRRPGERR